MKKLMFLIFFAVSIASCKVTFVGPKSQPALDLLNQIQTDATTIWTSPNLNFNQSAYTNVDNEIISLIAIDNGRIKAVKLVNQDTKIQTAFSEYEAEHRKKGVIVSSEANTYNIYFKSIVHPRVVSENSLK